MPDSPSFETLVRSKIPVYILCAAPEMGDEFDWPPPAIDGTLPMTFPDGAKERYGLLWGAGDPSLGRLGGPLWAVVKVFAYLEIGFDDRRAARFDQAEVVFEGDPPGALEHLISLGANPAKFGLELKTGGDNALLGAGAWGVAKAGAFGVASVGHDGWAQAGQSGIAWAGSDGIARVEAWGLAVADAQGHAHAGENGVAISDGKRFGQATAGDGGVAVGRGRFKIVEAGDAGVSVIVGGGGRASAGGGGVAVCRSDTASVGSHGVAVGAVVYGDTGALLVATRWDIETESLQYATGVVGQAGVQRYAKYECVAGALEPYDPSRGGDLIEP